jgi:23S rRNA U2552 (ribose-2'-O)-methylase RlmE/FtsJ
MNKTSLKNDKIMQNSSDVEDIKPKAIENPILILYELPSNAESDIFESESKPLFSAFPNMPTFKYGFYYYIHQTKDKMEMFEKPEFKTKDLQKIVNPFEDVVPQEDFIKQFKTDKIKSTDDINSYSIKYFKSDKIISRAFYKLWELLLTFPLINDNSESITTVHLAEAPGSFAQAVIFYRNKFFKKNITENDKYIGTSIESTNQNGGSNRSNKSTKFNKFNKFNNFNKLNKSNKPDTNMKQSNDNTNMKQSNDNFVPSFNSEILSNKQFNVWSYLDSDITNPEIMEKFIADYTKSNKNGADLITADGGFNWKDENYQEQEAYILLLAEIYCAVSVQKPGGSFVIKFFETFTELTVKMIEILRKFYTSVYITKPLLSRPSNSERYIVCMNFKKISNDKFNSYLNNIYDIIAQSYVNTNKYLVDIFPNYIIGSELDLIIKLSATQLSNAQHKQINEMISYINNGNYFGEDYRQYLLNRRNANDFWISIFFPLSATDLQTVRKLIAILVKKSLDKMNISTNQLKNKLQSNSFHVVQKSKKSDILTSDSYSDNSLSDNELSDTKPKTMKSKKSVKSVKTKKSAK